MDKKKESHRQRTEFEEIREGTEVDALTELLTFANFISDDILALLRVDNLSHTSVHIISGLESDYWGIRSYLPFAEGLPPSAPCHQVLILNCAGHYTLLETREEDKEKRNEYIHGMVEVFRANCLERNPSGLDVVVIKHAHPGAPTYCSTIHKKLPL